MIAPRNGSRAAGSPYASSLSFLLSQVGARSAQLFAEALAPIGVSPREFAILNLLAEGGPRTQQQLADALGMHRNNMVAVVDALEQGGLARRRANNTDRRAYAIMLTTAGERVVRLGNEAVGRIDALMTAALTAAELAEMSRLVGKVAGTLELTPGVHPHLAAQPRGRRL